MAAYLWGFDWALHWSLQPLSIAPVCNVTFGYKANTISLKEGGGASESASEWLQLNQNKERLIARWVLWKDWAEAIKQKDFQHLHQWHLSEQIFTVYYKYWYLLRLCTEKQFRRWQAKLPSLIRATSGDWELVILLLFWMSGKCQVLYGHKRSHNSCLRVFFLTALFNPCKL